jgi:hypothetical protein
VSRLPVLVLAIAIACAVWIGSRVINHRPFPADKTPEGAYARIALAVGERRPRDAFAYLETEAQWAAFTILKERKAACDRVRAAYPAEQGGALLDAWRDVAAAPDGPEVFARLAKSHGWIARLERDLSGVASVEIQGERASVVTAQGTRYPFRRRDNGIWGLTTFTAELQAEADKASRDLEVVERAAADYERAGVAEGPPHPRERPAD